MSVIGAVVAGCGDSVGVEPPATAFAMSVESPVAQEGQVGSPLPSPLKVRAYDSDGHPLANVEVKFAVQPGGGTISPQTVRTDDKGDAAASWKLPTKAGQYTATANSEGIGDINFFATAHAAPLVGQWTLNASSRVLIPGRAFQAFIRGSDVYGNPVETAAAVWRSSDDAVATVSGAGLIRGVTPGAAAISVTFNGTVSSPINVTVKPLEWTMIQADGGGSSSCGVTSSGESFCWGQVTGLGSYPQVVPDTALYQTITPNCGLSLAGNIHCGIGSSLHAGFPPASPLSSGTSFAKLSNRFSSCALTATGVAFCFGDNSWGQLGTGIAGGSPESAPTIVTGALKFTSISASGTHVCAIATSGKAYCWGKNDFGQLGTSSTNCGALAQFDPCATPTAVAGDVSFKSISAALRYTCGVAVDGTGYCWGDSTLVPWRDGLSAKNPSPSMVQGGFVFQDISVATSHACGLTIDGVAVCWGQNTVGALGRGTPTLSVTPGFPPAAVETSLTFSSISVGSQFSCAITPQKSAYCWGDNSGGELGNGKSANTTPNEPGFSVTPQLIPRVFE
jgi:hypothetical protein